MSKITCYDIYRFYHGNFKLNELTVNRHRGEKDASLLIGNKLTNDLTHKDFGDYRWRGDAFHFVKQIFNCDYPTALAIIDRDFNLGLGGDGKIIEGKRIVTWEQPEVLTKKPPFFQIKTLSTLTKEGWDYWSRLHQGEEDIKRENIYMAAEIFRNRRKMWLGNLLTFCFHYPEINAWKLYRPFAVKSNKQQPLHLWKWDTNIPFDYVEDLDNVRGCTKAFLAKTKKDKMVLRTALETTCIANLHAEDPACVSEETIEVFHEIPERYAIMDNDKKGKETSWWLTKEHGFKHVNVPDKYLTEDPKCTDFPDLAWFHGIEKVTEHFKSKGII